MVRNELIRTSPVRILERSTHGGVGVGNIGVFTARKGVGKTACLVHVATDRLLAGGRVIHVSFADSPHHILTWYEDIFEEIAARWSLDDAREVHDEIARNRIIMNFVQDGIHITAIESRVDALIRDAGFSADVMVIDGYDFGRSDAEELGQFRTFAAQRGLELWFSSTVGAADGNWDASVPPCSLSHVIDQIAVCISLRHDDGNVRLRLVKDHDAPLHTDLHLMLDPRVLIIREEAFR